MSDTVVVLKGDSTDLVAAMKKGGSAMGGLKDDSKKLTDQLKQVADQADVAAGKLVNKIGGPGAIKAIAGVGLAFGAAGVAFEAFSGSMDSFYKSKGPAGEAAMARVTQATDTLKGKFFEAVIGTGDMEEATQTLVDTLDGLGKVLDFLLTPVSTFSKAIRDLGVDHSQGAELARQHFEAEKAYADGMANLEILAQNTKKATDALLGSLRELLYSKEANIRADEDALLATFDAQIAANTLQASFRSQLAGETAMRKAELDQQDRELNDNAIRMAQFRVGKGKAPMGPTALREAAVQSILADLAVAARINKAGSDAYAAAAAASYRQTVTEVAEERRLLDARALAEQRIEERRYLLTQSPKSASRTGGSPGGGSPAGPPQPTRDVEADALEFLKKLIDARNAIIYDLTGHVMKGAYDPKWLDNDLAYAKEMGKFIAEQIKETGVQIAIEKKLWDMTKRPPVDIPYVLDDDPEVAKYKARALEMTAVMGRFYDWREIRDAETNKILDDVDAASTKSRAENIEAYMKSYGQAIAEQINAGASAAEIMEMVARKAMANVISFIGDEAMAKGAVMAAAGNPMAIAMFAAGTAAYATAAYLGATAKKATVSTPASSSRSEPGNSTYNLRVDATFADGESIARRFAEMQKAASQRGLIPAYSN